MKLFYCCFLIFMSSIVNAQTIDLGKIYSSDSQSRKDWKILRVKLSKLDEVKQLNIELRKYKKKAALMPPTKPTPENPYYEVCVGYETPSEFKIKFFYRVKKDFVNQSNIEPYVDILYKEGALYVPLLEYRKNKNKYL